MTIRRRLALSFLAILVLFSLNLAIHFWSDQKRGLTIESLRQAISRQILIAAIRQNLNDLQKQVALLSQVMVEAATGGAAPDEIARFNGQLEAVREQIQELYEISDPDARIKLESLKKAYQELSTSWSTFYKNFGIDHAKAITELAVRAEPMSQRVLHELVPQLQEDEQYRVEVASANFYKVARLMDRMTILIFAVSTLVALVVAYLVSRYLTRGLDELKRGATLVGSGDLGYRITIKARDELGNLAQAFNSMTANLFSARTQLTQANRELEAFSYSVSHDLRAPLRSINGFSLALLEDYAEKLDEQGKDYLKRVRAASQRMAQLIDDLLNLSHVTRSEMRHETVDLSALSRAIAAELQRTQPERQVTFVIAPGLVASGDVRLLRVVLENLLGNAWKFTGKHPTAKIEFGVTQHDGRPTYFVRDDGAGFDMAFGDKIFGAFQRLHSMTEFEGTGIGLATVQRIIHRHGGQVWAEGAVEQGATFHFTL
jgi:signal transduction histidine kinase